MLKRRWAPRTDKKAGFPRNSRIPESAILASNKEDKIFRTLIRITLMNEQGFSPEWAVMLIVCAQ